MELSKSTGVQRVRHEIRARELSVRRIEPLGASLLSITFGGAALDGFVSAGFDDHVKFIIPTDNGEEPVRRDYTPVWYNAAANELTLEFALHDGGAADAWARSAVVGQQAIIAGPRGSMVVPLDYDFHLLAGDRAALPAIRRRLAELPAGTRALLVIAATGADRLPIDSAAQVTVQWVDDDAAIPQALRELELPVGDGYAWFAGEAGIAKQVRAVYAEKGLNKDAMRVAAYWKRGIEAHHEQID